MTAQQTGVLLLPGALATAVSMAVAGRLTERMDARILVAAGAGFFAVSMVMLSRITAQSGGTDFFWPLIFRGLGLGMMFVPLTTLALAPLSPQELPQGAGLYNFFRQLGGSFGIAGIATLLARYTAQFKAVLAEHVTADAAGLGRLNQLTQAMVARGADPWTAKQRAYLLLDRTLSAQASVIAYGRIYVLAAAIIVALIPLLFLIGRPHRGGGDAAHLALE
jgi:DHA2 family multidrug resistance protein